MRRVQQQVGRHARRSSALTSACRSLRSTSQCLSASPPPPPPPPPPPLPDAPFLPDATKMRVAPPAVPQAPAAPKAAPKAAPEAPKAAPEAPAAPRAAPEAPKAAPEAPAAPKAAPEAPKAAPEAPKVAPAAPAAPKVAPEAPKAAPAAPAAPKVAPAAPAAPKVAPEAPAAPKAAPEAPKVAPAAPAAPKVAPEAPAAPKAAPEAPKAAPEAPKVAPEAPAAPRAAPEAPKAAPEAPAAPKAAPEAPAAPKAAPEAPKAAPEAPAAPRAAPEAPKAAPEAPAAPKAAPEAPAAPKAAPEAPAAPRAAPEAPKAAPEAPAAPKAAPEAPAAPRAAPEAPKAAPEAPAAPKAAPEAPAAPKAAPEAPKAAPEAPAAPRAAPEAPKAAPEAPAAPKAAPEAPAAPKAAPEAPAAPRAAPEAPKAAPEAPAAPKAAPAAPAAPKAAPEAPKAAPAAPAAPKAAPEAPKAAPAAPAAPRAAPEAPKAAPEAPAAPKAAPEAPKAAPAAPAAPKAAPEAPKAAPAAPAAPKAAPEAPKAAPAAPAAPRAAPEAPKAAPEAPAAPKAAPEAPKAAPAAPAAPRAAPEAPKAAPEAPAAPKAAPEAPKAAPAAPAAPRAAPEAPKAAPEAPAAPKAAPEAPKAAPAAPAAPKAAPEAPKAAPAAPAAPRAAPEAPKAAPEAPAAPKAAPEAPKAAPAAPKAAPEAPKAAREAPAAPKAAPEAPKVAPAAPAAPKAAPEAPKVAPAAPAAPKAAPEAPKVAPAAPAAPKVTAAAHTASPKRSTHPVGKDRAENTKTGGQRPKAKSEGVVRSASIEREKKRSRNASARTSLAQHPTAAPPPPPPPPPMSRSVAPPAPPATLTMHVTIAPPGQDEDASTSDAAATAVAQERELFEALRPSLATRIEAAVRQGKATHPLRTIQPESAEATPVKAAAAAGDNAADGREARGDWAAARREERLQPLPDSIANSLDHHEIPAELGGGSEGAVQEQAKTVPSHKETPAAKSAPRGAERGAVPVDVLDAAAVERLPTEVWRGVVAQATSAPPTAATASEESDSCYRVTMSHATSSQPHISVQFHEAPASPMTVLRAVASALRAVEAQCAEMSGAEDSTGSSKAPATPRPPVTVTWSALPHCPFFGSVRSPAELSLQDRVDFVAAKEEVIRAFHDTVRRLHGAACFIAVVPSSAGPVEDFGAEVFFACPERYLLPASSSLNGGAFASASVGFPLARLGLFPATRTVDTLRRLCGAQSTLKWVPVLHSYDAESLAEVGLLRLGEQAESATAFVAGDTPSTGGRDIPHADRTFQWSLQFEDFLLRYACHDAPARRRWVLEHLVLSRDALQSTTTTTTTGARCVAETWCEYAMGVFCDGDDAASGATDGNVPAAEVGSAALLRSFVATAPCRGAAHAAQVRLGSLHRPLPALPHRRFLAFPHTQQHSWAEKMQALTADPDSCGAAVLLDCSDRAVAATLELVTTHFVATPEQRARLPFLNMVLIGEDAAAQPVLACLPCAAVIASSSALVALDHASVQQVRLYASPQWPIDLQQDTLVAALAYLQRKATPFVVAAGPAPQRLLLALCSEALVLARSMPDASRIETAAQVELGTRLGPFALMDAYGAVTLSGMAAEVNAAAPATPTPMAASHAAPHADLVSCTRAMAREGLLGLRGARGGFYGPAAAAAEAPGSGAARALRASVLDRYVRHHATSAAIADRLRAAVLNVACELLVRGDVDAADDVDVLSLSTLGWAEETGGVLYQVDQLGVDGLPRLVEFMTSLASTGVAPHLAPHPLLSAMAAQQVRFANLKGSGLLSS